MFSLYPKSSVDCGRAQASHQTSQFSSDPTDPNRKLAPIDSSEAGLERCVVTGMGHIGLKSTGGNESRR